MTTSAVLNLGKVLGITLFAAIFLVGGPQPGVERARPSIPIRRHGFVGLPGFPAIPINEDTTSS